MHPLEFIQAEVRLGRKVIWSDANIRVGRGEFVAVLGPNGVGKSTLIKAILGLMPLSAGQVTVLGRSPSEARHQIGYLPQRRSFDPGLRVRGIDVVRLGLEGQRWGFPLPGLARLSGGRRAQDRRIEEVINHADAAPYAP